MHTTEQIIHVAERQCKDSGVRLTQKRKQVLAALLDANKALSAYEVVDYCAKQYKQVMPAMSVYRILDFLKQEHLVHKLNLANKYVACSHIACSHAHEVSQFLICTNCQCVEEVMMQPSTVQDIQDSVHSAGFELLSPQLEINCLCADCAQ